VAGHGVRISLEGREVTRTFPRLQGPLRFYTRFLHSPSLRRPTNSELHRVLRGRIRQCCHAPGCSGDAQTGKWHRGISTVRGALLTRLGRRFLQAERCGLLREIYSRYRCIRMRWNAEPDWESQVFCANPRGMVEGRTRTHARRKNTLTKAKVPSASSKIGGEWSDRNSDRKYPCVVLSPTPSLAIERL